MLENDYMIRNIETMVRFIAGLIFKKDTTRYEIKRDENGNITTMGEFCLTLHDLVDNGEINKAEDMLFTEMEKAKSPEYLEIGVDFYGYLNDLPDEFLDENNFSRQEITEGVRDMQKLYGIDPTPNF